MNINKLLHNIKKKSIPYDNEIRLGIFIFFILFTSYMIIIY